MISPEDRAWEVVRRAFDERTPVTRRRAPRTRLVLAGAVVVAAVVAGAAVTPSGRAVFRSVREAVGIEHAAPALIALPGGGRLLVESVANGGTWLVDADGKKRDLGPYTDAAWSPHGLFIVATRGNELLALDDRANVRWTLSRIDPSWPVWTGTRTDTRIAYVSASGLRVVAGDGTGDHLLDRFGGGVPPAWNPSPDARFELAYYTGGAIVLRHADGRLVWRHAISLLPAGLAWSSDGRYLAVRSASRVLVLDAAGRLRRTISTPGAFVAAAVFAPGSHRLALSLRRARRSEVRIVDVDRPAEPAGRLVLAGPGDFGDVAWGPHGRWLLVTWPAANQWVFLQGARTRAVGNIEAQFPRPDRRPPELQVAGGWCCPG